MATHKLTIQESGENGQGPMKVFIINQPVKNVIQAGNNLIVETETPIKTEEMQGDQQQQDQQQHHQLSLLSQDTNDSGQQLQQLQETESTSQFDPSKHSFSQEELQVNPTKKRPVPDDEKDAGYWERRKKNNMAAKRSRESRRNRDNQVTERTAFLENENITLKNRINEVRSEILDVKEKLQHYQIMCRDPEIHKQANQAMHGLWLWSRHITRYLLVLQPLSACKQNKQHFSRKTHSFNTYPCRRKNAIRNTTNFISKNKKAVDHLTSDFLKHAHIWLLHTHS